MLAGVSRKLALVPVFLSACGWVVFVTGFGIRNGELDDIGGSNLTVVEPHFFSHWCFCVSGAFLYFIYFLHLLWGNTVTSFLTMLVLPLYLAMVGAVLQYNSSSSPGPLGDSFPHMVHSGNVDVYLLVEYVGALVAGTFLWLALLLWPLHSYRKQERNYEPINS